MKKGTVVKIFEILREQYGTEELVELKYVNVYTLLVSVILSAQTTDRGVNRATEELFRIVQTPGDMLLLGENNLKKYIKTINYYNTKAKHIINMSKKIAENFNSNVPNNFKDLISLDGVGRKTANVVLNIAFGKSSIAVDTHVFRVSNRLGLVNAKTVFDTERQLLEIVPKKYVKFVNHYLVMFGRYKCKAIGPKCDGCILRTFCNSTGGNLSKSLNL
ncbi:MAG: endonuclease III [Rickettsiales bacterium]|jgi:endonuclease-3|nr:endonuclease III [Rickettsiales bacterium]